MNQDKAREFFSALYEGNLEPGVRQSLEVRLRDDLDLQADYAAFASTMDDLGRLRDEEIEAPVFLSDRISTRLEQEMARRPSATPIWATWLRGVAFAGLGAAAIAGAVFSFHSSGGASVANPLPTSEDQPRFASNGSSIVLNYRPSAARTVVVSSAVNGRELERFTADATTPAHTFENRLSGTALFQVQIQGDSPSYVFAIPGPDASGSSAAPNSPGSIKDFAVALSTHYHLPVVLHASDTSKRLIWKFDGLDPDRAAANALAAEPYVVDQREDGVLTISDR